MRPKIHQKELLVRGALAFALGLLLLSSLPATSGGTGDRQSAIVTVDTSTTFQTITAWEATAWMGQDSSPNLANYSDEVMDMAVGELGLNRLRLEVRAGAENPEDYWTQWQNGTVDYAFWRSHRYTTINDDADPDHINWSGFQFSELDRTVETVVLPFMQRVSANGETPLVNLNYVAFTSQNGAGLPYIHDDPEEYAELMLATFIHLEGNYSLVPDYLEILLEPDNVSQWNGVTIGNAIVATAGKLADHGYTPRFIAPSNTNMGGAITYFDQMATVPGAIENLTELSYHRYGGVSDANLRAIDQRRVQHGLDTSMLEHIGSGHEDLYKDLTIANCSSWQQFCLAGFGPGDGGGCYLLIDETDPSDPVVTMARRTRFLAQYFRFIREGAVRVGASSSDGTFEPAAFVNRNDSRVVVVKAGSAGSVSVRQLPAGTYGIRYTTNAERAVDLPDVEIVAGEYVDASIPAAGVITVFSKGLDSGLDVSPRDPEVTMHENETLNFTVSFVGTSHGHTVSWRLDGEVISGWDQWHYEYHANYTSAGLHTLNVTLTTAIHPFSNESFVWNITVLNVNRPPAIGAFGPLQESTVQEMPDGAVRFNVTVSDPDVDDTLTHTWTVDSVEVQNGTADIYWFPVDFNSSGDHDISVTVTDGIDAVSLEWLLHVLDVNRPPEIVDRTPEGVATVLESAGGVELSVKALDPDGDPLAYSWYVDGVLVTGAGSPAYMFPLDFDSAGVHTVLALVNDSRLDASAEWSVVVLDVPRPPVIDEATPEGEVVVDEEENGTVEFSVVARDPDGTPISYAWSVNGLPVEGEDGPTFALPYDHHSAGTWEVRVRVEDGYGSADHTWTVTVRNVNRPPAIISADPPSPFSLGDWMTQMLGITVSDPDQDDSLSIEWFVDGSPQGPGDLTFTYDPATGDLGEHNVTVLVRDLEGASDSHTWTAAVTQGGDPAPDDDDDDDGIPFWALVAVAVLLVLLLLAVGVTTLRKGQ